MSIIPNDFYIDVVSNASMGLYPTNTLSKFKNKLSHEIELNGKWVVGVQEIFYPLHFKPEKRIVNFFLTFLTNDKKINIGPEHMFEYIDGQKINDLVTNINSRIDHAVNESGLNNIISVPKLQVGIAKTIILTGKSSEFTIIPNFTDEVFIQMLGFDMKTYVRQLNKIRAGKTDKMVSPSSPNFSTRSHLLFVYTDIIQEHDVGDHKARVLRVVPLSNKMNYEMGHVSFPQPIYFPVRLHRLDEISVMLCDENGNQVQFETGRVYLSLHFKQIV